MTFGFRPGVYWGLGAMLKLEGFMAYGFPAVSGPFLQADSDELYRCYTMNMFL